MMNSSVTKLNHLQIPQPQKQVINHLLKKFLNNPSIDSVFLFGSCARGVANENSDIDMLVVTNSKVYDDSHEAFDTIYGGADDIPLEHYVSCDILTATKDEFHHETTPLIKTVKREGVKLICKQVYKNCS